LPHEINKVDENFIPDVHIFASYRGWIPPKSTLNFQICFYPVFKKIDGWTKVLVINDFVGRCVKKNWPGVEVFLLPAFYEVTQFSLLDKEPTCICIGNYFEEPDGHSKNQHLIIDWFKNNKVKLGLNSLVLHGFKNDEVYYNKLLELIGDDSSIFLNNGVSSQKVREDLSKSSYFKVLLN
jgi:hypothetical protein